MIIHWCYNTGGHFHNIWTNLLYIEKIDQPCQTNEIMKRINLIYCGSVFNTLLVPSRMTNEEITACNPLHVSGQATRQDSMGPTLTLIARFPGPASDLHHLGHPPFGEQLTWRHRFAFHVKHVVLFIFNEAHPCSWYSARRIHVLYVNETELYPFGSVKWTFISHVLLNESPDRLCSLLEVSFSPTSWLSPQGSLC